MVAKLTLGPIPFHWSAEVRRDFYSRIADEAPVDTVYLGEVICSKRAPFFEAEIPKTMERLQRAGKTVVLSTLAEVMLARERKATADLVAMEGVELEINNAAGLHGRSGKPHRIGPFLNAYNEATIAWMASQRATHICLPPEMPGAATAVAAEAARGLGLGLEVQVFGRAALAVSARCYHARSHGRTKDNCQFVCEQDADGMPLETLDGKSFLRINGIQTMSDSYINLSSEIAELSEMGVGHLRLVPQQVDMVAVSGVYHELISGGIDTEEADSRLGTICTGIRFSNGFFHGTAGYRRIARSSSMQHGLAPV